MNDALPLSPEQLLIAAALLVLAGLVSIALRLGLEKRLAIAAARTVIQLLAIGYVLRWVFSAYAGDTPEDPLQDLLKGPATAALVAIMIAVASRSAIKRPSRTFAGAGMLAFVSLTLAGLFVTCTVTAVIIRVEPWYTPQYLIPLLGMVLGNGLTGISLCLDQFLEQLDDRRALIEMELAHGATAWEAAREPLAEAVRRGMIPIINSMTVVGLVSLPGMMTGQILQGAPPLQAVRYQIVVMFMIAAAVSLGCMLLGGLAFRALFNERHQLRREQIRRQKT